MSAKQRQDWLQQCNNSCETKLRMLSKPHTGTNFVTANSAMPRNSRDKSCPLAARTKSRWRVWDPELHAAWHCLPWFTPWHAIRRASEGRNRDNARGVRGDAGSGWLRGTVGRTSVFDRRTFPVLLSTCSWRVTTYVGKPSAVGQPTRPGADLAIGGPGGRLPLRAWLCTWENRNKLMYITGGDFWIWSKAN